MLQRKLPSFPPLTWQALHILMGLGVGVVVALLELEADSAPRENLTPSSILSIAVGGTMIGAFMGAAAGALQALVLRKAARGRRLDQMVALAGTTLGGLRSRSASAPISHCATGSAQLLGFAIAVPPAS